MHLKLLILVHLPVGHREFAVARLSGGAVPGLLDCVSGEVEVDRLLTRVNAEALSLDRHAPCFLIHYQIYSVIIDCESINLINPI